MNVPTPAAVMGLLGPSPWSKMAIENITTRLLDRDYVLNAMRNKTVLGFTFTEDGEPTPGDRIYIVETFQKAGWSSVTIKTEEHRNEYCTTIELSTTLQIPSSPTRRGGGPGTWEPNAR